jgi:hypothetical protein
LAQLRSSRGRGENAGYQESLSPPLRTFDYTAGQHVDVPLTAPNGYTAMRSYSIASASSDSKVIELAIERLADGEDVLPRRRPSRRYDRSRLN